MYYYTFKAISNDGKIVKEYLYNEAVNDKFSKEVMMTLTKEFIKKDLESEGLNIKDFTFTRKLQSYKEFRERYTEFKFINNRNPTEAEAVPEELKQSDEDKERNSANAKKYSAKARLPKSPYGSWSKRDPLYKY